MPDAPKASPVLFAKGRIPRPDVPCRVLGIDPGWWTGLTLLDPGPNGGRVLQATTVSRYAIPGYQPDRDYHARNVKQWFKLRASGLSKAPEYDQDYIARIKGVLLRLVTEYRPFKVVMEAAEIANLAMGASPFKAETMRQATLAYGAVLGMVDEVILVTSGDNRGKWGQPSSGGAGTKHHYPPELRGRAKPAFYINDTELVADRLGWETPEAYEHPRESYDHITQAVWDGRLTRKVA